MINNFLNVNKTNNHLSPQIIEQKIKTMTYDNGNSGLGLRQAQTYGMVKPLNGFPTGNYQLFACLT
jgi:hypothetical protein